MTKIFNLYDPRGQAVLREPRCYWLEKVDGCPASVRWQDARMHFSPGASEYGEFYNVFNAERLRSAFQSIGAPTVIVYGEAYGGRLQGLARRYGDVLRFAPFEVRVGGTILAVPEAAALVDLVLGLEHVPWGETPTDLTSLHALRDAPSVVAARCGMGVQPREGIVLRPLVEAPPGDEGPRVIAKHKARDNCETRTARDVNVAASVVYEEANDYALEWVTDERLRHVTTRMRAHIGRELTRNDTVHVVDSMVRDVRSEAPIGEVPHGAEIDKAIKRRAATLYLATFQK